VAQSGGVARPALDDLNEHRDLLFLVWSRPGYRRTHIIHRLRFCGSALVVQPLHEGSRRRRVQSFGVAVF
jgi:hypothetical protein